jgi:uncharacterized protein (UPF0297 family)
MSNQNTEKYNAGRFDSVFLHQIESICRSILAAGMDPYSQLTGYLLTGEDCYITRTGRAREMIATLDRSQLQTYVKLHLEK